MTGTLDLAFDGGIARITFARPDVLNAIDLTMARAFAAAVGEIAARDDVRVVTIEGAGRSFMAGGDLAAFADAENTEAYASDLIEAMHGAVEALADAPFITLAIVRGPVAGAGLSLVLGCDLSIAAESASFNMAYGAIGNSPDCGGTYYLPRVVGLRKAMALALLNDPVSASEALALGIVSRVVDDGALAEAGAALAARLARGPFGAQGRIKALLNASQGRSLSDQLRAEADGFLEGTRGAEFREGVAAFRARRAPDFGGA